MEPVPALQFELSRMSDIPDAGWNKIGDSTIWKAVNRNGVYQVVHRQYNNGSETVSAYYTPHPEAIVSEEHGASLEGAQRMCRSHAERVHSGQMSLF